MFIVLFSYNKWRFKWLYLHFAKSVYKNDEFNISSNC